MRLAMQKTVKLHDKTFRVMIPAEQIDRAVQAVADSINRDYAHVDTPLFVGVLNGSFMFLSDLIKKNRPDERTLLRQARLLRGRPLHGQRPQPHRAQQFARGAAHHHRRGYCRHRQQHSPHD